MITKQEILDLSWEFGLEAKTIEKDYVLGWLLAGIASHSALFDKWIFKGGTCLKKCYFETFRFSEDLDYTLIEKTHVDPPFLVNCFKEIAGWIYGETGIQIPHETIRFDVYRSKAGREAVQGRVGYIGPLKRRGDPVRIKLDLTTDEILVAQPDLRQVHHPYSDRPEKSIRAYCYSFPEVIAEKLRALSERARPRDLYDVVHLFRHACLVVSPDLVTRILKEKCRYKNILVPTMEELERHPQLDQLETEWANMLAHQLPILPPREKFWQELPDVFSWLQEEKAKTSLKSILLPDDVDLTWNPPSMIRPWGTSIPLELIRYAGANYLCVEVEYEEELSSIEPYELKRSQEGNLFLIAIKRNAGEILPYSIDQIKKITITQEPFIPRYRVALTPIEL